MKSKDKLKVLLSSDIFVEISQFCKYFLEYNGELDATVQ